MRDVFHVDDDALFGGGEITDFVSEMRGMIGDEFAVAFDDGGAFDAVGVEAEGTMRRGLGSRAVTTRRAKPGTAVPCPYSGTDLTSGLV